MMKKLYHGAAYYPELWDDATIDEDIRYMKEIGINVVRIGEFIWSKLEPAEDRIDTGYLAAIIDRLYRNGIEVVLGTPTPTPPVWVSHGHPERMHVDAEGRVMSHGARQHVCTNHPYMRQRSRVIIEAIARAVGGHPAVVAWQLDNEFKCHVKECFCAECKTLWQEWLAKRYGSIENLNRQWGTMIWSELYQSFDQVPQPVTTPFLHNPSLTTAYRLFTMEKIAEYADEQMEIIRRYSKAPITHNGSFGFLLDNERLYRNMDEAAFDTYAEAGNYPAYMMCLDFWRNVKQGKDYWLMETSTSHNGHTHGFAKIHPRGYLAIEAVAAYALGAKAFIYWLWRQQRTGCEITHGAVLSVWGRPAVGYEAVLEVERTRRQLEPLILATRLRQAELAITYSDRAKAFLLSEPHHDLEYRGLMQEFYTNVLHVGIDRDLILEGAPLDGYKLLLTPYMPYVSAEYFARAKEFVENGGIWIAGPLTGGRTEVHTIPTDAGLGIVESIAGAETLYTYPIDGSGAIGTALGLKAPLQGWSAVFRCKEATMVGAIEGGLHPGLAFITEHRVGKGKVVLLGSRLAGAAGQAMLQALIDHYATEAGITMRTNVTAGTVVARRAGEKGELWIIFNIDGNGGSLTIPEEGRDGLTGAPVRSGILDVESYGFRVVRFEQG
jgi:beta-galactosidase